MRASITVCTLALLVALAWFVYSDRSYEWAGGDEINPVVSPVSHNNTDGVADEPGSADSGGGVSAPGENSVAQLKADESDTDPSRSGADYSDYGRLTSEAMVIESASESHSIRSDVIAQTFGSEDFWTLLDGYRDDQSSSLDAQRLTEDYRALFDAFESQNGAFGYDLLDLACGNRSCIGAARFSSDHSEGWESLLAFLDAGSTDPYSAIGAQLVDLGNGEMEYRFLFSIDPFAAVVGQHSGDGPLTVIRADEPTATPQPPEGSSDG